MRSAVRIALIACLAMAGATIARVAMNAQGAPRGVASTRTVNGQVTAEDGAPLARVNIAVDSSAQSVQTDNAGAFQLVVPASGPQTLTASRAGYATRRVPIGDGMVIQLAKGAAITGRVSDDGGSAWPTMIVVAVRRLVDASGVRFEPQASAVTDDRGAFRIFGLAAGEYIVGIAGSRLPLPGSMTLPNGPPGGPVRTYYPDAPDTARAQVFTVRSGTEIPGITFTVPVPPPPNGVARFTIVSAGETGTIRGTVFGADGFPSRTARAQLASADRLFSPFMAPAIDGGHFEFRGVPPGRYLVTAMAPPYVNASFGQRTSGDRGAIITLAKGESADAIDIRMPHTAAIVGRLFDGADDPVERAAVSIERVRWVGGRRRLTPAAAIGPGVSDDLGEFRLFGVAPGSYLVSATINSADQHIRTYFPGTPSSARAARVEVSDSDDTVVVTFPVSREPGMQISGRVVDPDGRPFSGAVFLIASARSGALAPSQAARVRTDDGTFAFRDLVAGEYLVQAGMSREGPSVEGALGTAFVTVTSEDVPDVLVRLSPGSSVRGRFIFDGDAPTADAENVQLSAIPSDQDYVSLAGDPVARASIEPDWSFEMQGLNGPRRLQLLEAPSGWRLQAIVVNGQDVTDTPLAFGSTAQSMDNVEIRLTNLKTAVSGLVTDGHNHPASDASVVVFAVDPQRRYAQSRFVRISEVTGDGIFTLSDAPPGEYYAAVVNGQGAADAADQLDNPDFLDSLAARASRFVVPESGEVTLGLRAPE